MPAPVHILETTVRDGGYEIGHDWGEEDVALFVSLLDAAGFKYLEIGHGIGTGNQRYRQDIRPKSRALLTDEDHMRIGRAVARRAKLGVVVVPGEQFSPLDQIDLIAAGRMDFVRLTYMPSDCKGDDLRYITRARDLGLLVSVNLMQTYVRSPSEVAKIAADCKAAGAEWFYVVDSAGGMRPTEVQEYVRAILGETGMTVGLHAHNNGGQAVANALAAVEAGATLIDSTLNGIGRATGNPPTEQALLALQARGHELDVDLDTTLRGGAIARNLYQAKGNDPLDFVSGQARIHSRNVPGLRALAKERGRSASQLTIEVGRAAQAAGCLEMLKFPEALLDGAVAKAGSPVEPEPTPQLLEVFERRARARAALELEAVHESLRGRAAKRGVKSAVHLASADAYPFAGPLAWDGARAVGVSLPATAHAAPPPGPLHLLVLDPGVAAPAWASKLPTLRVAFRDAWLDATAALARAAAAKLGGVVWVAGDGGAAAIDRLASGGVAVAKDRPAEATAVVAFGGNGAWVDALRAGDLVILAGPWREARALADVVRKRGARPLTPPVGRALAARVDELLELGDALDRAEAPADGWVALPSAPGAAEALVDLGTGDVVDAGAKADGAAAISRARARLLLAGRLPI